MRHPQKLRSPTGLLVTDERIILLRRNGKRSRREESIEIATPINALIVASYVFDGYFGNRFFNDKSAWEKDSCYKCCRDRGEYVVTEIFKAPFVKLDRAHELVTQLRSEIVAYQAVATSEFVRTEREYRPWELSLSPAVPDIVSLLVSEIAHHLRTSLDIMMCDIAAYREVGLSDMSFPFAENEEKLVEKLDGNKHPSAKLGDDIVQMIKDLQPWKGGNSALRRLHDLNNQDKHRMLAPNVQLVSTGADIGASLTAMTGVLTVTNKRLPVALQVGRPLMSELFREHPNEAYEINDAPICLTFPDDYVIEGELATVMDELTQSIRAVVNLFKAQLTGRQRPAWRLART